MSPKLHLYGYDICPFSIRVRMLLEVLHLDYGYTNVEVYAQKPAALLKHSPLGKVPTLLVDIESLSESSVIARWLAEVYQEQQLLSRNAWQKAKQQELMELIEQAHSAVSTIIRSESEQSFQAGINELSAILPVLHQELREEVTQVSTLVDVWKLVLCSVIRNLDCAIYKALSNAIPQIRNYPNYQKSSAAVAKLVAKVLPHNYEQQLRELLLNRAGYCANLIASERQVEQLSA